MVMANNEIAKTVGVISALCTVIGIVVTLLFHALVLGSEFGTIKANQLETRAIVDQHTIEFKTLTPTVQYYGWRIDSIVHQMH